MLSGRTPTKAERFHMEQITQLGCIVCLLFERKQTPAEVHHLDGKTKEGAHFLTIPLCFLHHRQGSNNDRFVSRHPHKAEFERRYLPEAELLARTMRMIELGL